ncbi:NTP transferase domain-containing protein [Halostella sp. JP-L12]|uniref:bifunctional sugar-1-phosphate nucleotidylyltransferase/acetyltransferase n=1 Tax=Halostella TaxID=1843185 RepID=UPI000EF80603|nr:MULTISPECIES: bifunctional sugar-1-phosphate nucleotidylyltransferase/acetyltransferase [Halostella]NHN48713.1 NTP transferase domain-containing protein [Halostella sp. JP-L12]
MKAVILAAGEGQRLEPLTNRRPKPMVPIANQPLLEYVIDSVSDAGIDEIVLVVGYKRERIQTYFGDGHRWGVDIEYAVQEKQLGTGHAVLQAEDYVDDEFLVLNGDRIITADLVEQLVETRSETSETVMAVTRADDPTEYGVVTLDGDRVTGITEKPRAPAAPSDIVNAGVYAFDQSVFDAIREIEPNPAGELALTAAIERHLDDEPVRAARYRGLWVDVSYLWDVTAVTAQVLDELDDPIQNGVVDEGARVADDVRIGSDTRVGANATIRRGTALGNNVTVGANAVLSNVVAFDDATIGDGAVLRDCIVAENATVGPNTTVPGGPADVVVDDTYCESVDLGAVVGDNASVGGGSVLVGGTIIGDGATVQDGVTVSGRVPTDAEVRRG